MPRTKSKKSMILYGLLMGGLLIFLQVVNYNTIIRDLRIEVFGVCVAIIFLGIGFWFGSRRIKNRKKSKKQVLQAKKYNLSARELDVLNLIVDGLTNKEIADRLYVSHNTIKTHTSNIYSKLNVSRRTKAIQKALEFQLI